LFFLCSTLHAYQLSHFDEFDRFVGYLNFTDNDSRIVGCPKYVGTFPKNTPTSVSNEIKDQFPKKAVKAYSEECFLKDKKLNEYSTSICLDKIIFTMCFMADRMVTDIQDVCLLPPGAYNWVMTNDFQMTYSVPAHQMEWNVQHMHLSAKRETFVGGHLEVTEDGTEIRWNIESGSFTDEVIEEMKKWGTPDYRDLLLKYMKKVWEAHKNCDERKFVYDEYKFPKQVGISHSYMVQKCSGTPVSPPGIRAYWEATFKEVCTDLSCFDK